jgi:hypothetical protein
LHGVRSLPAERSWDASRGSTIQPFRSLITQAIKTVLQR